jgi:hypothetical protein
MIMMVWNYFDFSFIFFFKDDISSDIESINSEKLEKAYKLYREALLGTDFEKVVRTGNIFFTSLGNDRQIVNKYILHLIIIYYLFIGNHFHF